MYVTYTRTIQYWWLVRYKTNYPYCIVGYEIVSTASAWEPFNDNLRINNCLSLASSNTDVERNILNGLLFQMKLFLNYYYIYQLILFI